MGLIEAPVVAPFKKEKGYLLLDGHLRIMALKELGVECMIVKAVQSGVSEEKLARALNLDIGTIRNKRYLLEGICPEAVDLLKDKAVPEPVFKALKRMNAPRQITAAMLMNDQNKFNSNYAKALLEATPSHQLVNRGKPRKETPAILARQARLEEESLALSREIGSLKE